MATNGNPWALGSDTHNARVLRNLVAAVFGLPMASHGNAVAPTTRGGAYGVINSGDLLVTSTGGLGWSCAPGQVVASGTFAQGQGAYTGYNDAARTGTLAAHSAFIRHDLFCYRVRDTDEDATTFEDDDIIVVQGISGSTDPAIPSSLGSLVILARGVVPATSGAVTYTDLRPFATAIGGVQRVRANPTGGGLFSGLHWWRLDELRRYLYDGSATHIDSEAPVSWTPVINQGGIVATTNTYSRVQRSRGYFKATASLAVTGAGAPGNIQVNTPYTLANLEGVTGTIHIFDQNLNVIHHAAVSPVSTTGVYFLAHGGTASGLGASPAVVLAAGDVIRIGMEGWYA